MKCAKYDQIRSEMNSRPYQKLNDFLDKNAETIAYVSTHIGRVSKCLIQS